MVSRLSGHKNFSTKIKDSNYVINKRKNESLKGAPLLNEKDSMKKLTYNNRRNDICQGSSPATIL